MLTDKTAHIGNHWILSVVDLREDQHCYGCDMAGGHGGLDFEASFLCSRSAEWSLCAPLQRLDTIHQESSMSYIQSRLV